MAVKTEEDLSPNARALFVRATQAAQLQNFGYSVTLMQTVLKECPEFLDGRRLLRRAEVQQTKGKRSMLGGISAVSLKGSGLLKKDPRAAIELAERTLEGDPYSPQANHLLKEAAMLLDMPETAAFALETIVEGNPKDTRTLHELAELFYKTGQNEKAVEVYNRIVALNPADLVAIKRGKDASARATMATGGWETAKDYRDLIKDKEVAVSLEQQSRVVRDVEMIDRLLNELYQQAEAEPTNVDLARRIAGLWEQKEEFENAVWWYQRAAELTNNADATILRKAFELQMKVLDRRIAAAEAAGEGSADEVKALRQQRAEVALAEARRRVERNPADLHLRFELGEQLVAAGQFTEAIPELQRARSNPNVRVRAMSLLGRCYSGKSMLDLAVRSYRDAAKELPQMDATKKDVLYSLGEVYERLGEKAKALECFKEIYDVDYHYRDVASRVESSYGAV